MIRRWFAFATVAAIVLAGCSRPSPSPESPAAEQLAVHTSPVVTDDRVEPPLGHGTFAAVSLDRLIDVYHRPDPTTEPRFRLDTINGVGEPLALLVSDQAVDASGDAWLKVLLPIRPNGAAGWVHMSDVRVEQMEERILVDLSSRTLRHFVDGELVDEFSVGIGRPETPTATGTFYIWAHVPQASPYGPYGVYALGLSGFSEVLKDWPGGGRMGIHGTSHASDEGQMVSHGCVRVYNDEMKLLKRAPLGTPVIIRQ